MDVIIKRRSPDWLSFDVQATRRFCRDLGLPETLILDYVEDWNDRFPVSWSEYRHGVKIVAQRCLERFSDVRIRSFDAIDSEVIDDDDIVFFTDDDDWVGPDLFHILREHDTRSDGFVWCSIGVASRYDPLSDTHDAVMVSRPFAGEIHTNNYAVRGRAMRRLGLARVLEHFDAQQSLEQGELRLTPLDLPLSAANKHLACTTFIARPTRGMPRPDDLAAALRGLQASLERTPPPPGATWLGEPLAEYLALNRRLLT